MDEYAIEGANFEMLINIFVSSWEEANKDGLNNLAFLDYERCIWDFVNIKYAHDMAAIQKNALAFRARYPVFVPFHASHSQHVHEFHCLMIIKLAAGIKCMRACFERLEREFIFERTKLVRKISASS